MLSIHKPYSFRSLYVSPGNQFHHPLLWIKKNSDHEFELSCAAHPVSLIEKLPSCTQKLTNFIMVSKKLCRICHLQQHPDGKMFPSLRLDYILMQLINHRARQLISHSNEMLINPVYTSSPPVHQGTSIVISLPRCLSSLHLHHCLLMSVSSPFFKLLSAFSLFSPHLIFLCHSKMCSSSSPISLSIFQFSAMVKST